METFPINAPFKQTAAVLDQCINRLTAALRANTQPRVSLYDPVDEAPTPRDHYGQTATALALAIQEGPSSGFWRHPLEAWEALPAHQTGHAPFNRFLLNLLAEHLEQSGASASEVSHIRRLARRCKLSRGYPSNNWTLLARLCELQEANGNARIRAHARLRGLFDRWITPSGAFVDYPAHPGIPAHGATPAAYHHKALFVAVMAAEYGNQDVWKPIIKRLLTWSLYIWDGHGHVGSLGRSSHALFGDACLVASLLLLGAAEDRHPKTAPGRMLEGVLARWAHQIRPDGFLGLNPADTAKPGTGWDDYMHLSVYNAWAAALVAWSRGQAGRTERDRIFPLEECESAPPTCDGLEILRVGDPSGTLALVSARGQPPQGFSRDTVELRYAGGIPLHVTWQGKVLCPAPVRIPAKTLLETPALAGWTPIFLIDGQLFGLTDFERCETDASKEYLQITLWGRPRPLLRPAEKGLPKRALAALDWRLLGGALGRRAALQRHAFRPLAATLSLTISLRRPRLSQRLELEYDGQHPVTYLNPGGHTMTGLPMAKHSFQWETKGTPKGHPSNEWLERALPSAIAGGRGVCQSPERIAKGSCRSELILEWPARVFDIADSPC
ncbi:MULTISPECIES: hypothetical protein [unclassified Thioalkalivibrio]|uniref:hypothetical protein n=1 Tax=unclassified Thioalkalivibrio TaxID=2621013 RepID=UPI00037D6DCC|nr:MULTISPECIES: hypothetical protein [unclassified Thioalkalivibrio]